MAIWKDTSSYSRGERGEVEPSAWELDSCPFRVTVHRYHGDSTGWYLSAPDVLRIERKKVGDGTAEEAQSTALAYLAGVLVKMQVDLADAVAFGPKRVTPRAKENRVK